MSVTTAIIITRRLLWRFPSKRRWLTIAGIAIAAYLVVLVVLLLLENRMLFHPHRSRGECPPPADLEVQDVWLQTTDGTGIHAWWCPCASSQGAILYCHGNGGSLSHRGTMIRTMIKALGQSVLVFDYAGFGRSEGEPSETGCYAAADAAYDWLARKVPSDRIVILGESLGGGVATDLASRQPHQALILAKTFSSFPDMAQKQLPFFPARWLVHNRFDNVDKIRHCRPPIFIAHGDCDDLIPLSQAQRLFQAATEPKRFLLMRGCGHNGGLTPEFLAGLGAFLKEIKAANFKLSSHEPWSDALPTRHPG